MKVAERPGTVVGIKGEVALVEISGSKGGARVVEVANRGQDLQIGQSVIVLAEARVSDLAVKMSYVLPIVLFVATFFALRRATGNEGLAWLLAIFTLIPYYTILWIITSRISRMSRFRLKN
jgi:positive regulator of sigma E activity